MRTKLPKLLLDENTPKGTIVKCHCINDDDIGKSEELTRYFVSYDANDKTIIAARYRSADGIYAYMDRFYNFEIDIEADLQYRAFINAPKEYRWFAIDDNTEGHVFIDKPVLQTWMDLGGERKTWEDLKCSGTLGVGLFTQYQSLYKEILIERKD